MGREDPIEFYINLLITLVEWYIYWIYILLGGLLN